MARDYKKIKDWQRTEQLALLVYAKEFQKMEIELISYILGKSDA